MKLDYEYFFSCSEVDRFYHSLAGDLLSERDADRSSAFMESSFLTGKVARYSRSPASHSGIGRFVRRTEVIHWDFWLRPPGV
jgi:hypothetical protein